MQAPVTRQVANRQMAIKSLQKTIQLQNKTKFDANSLLDRKKDRYKEYALFCNFITNPSALPVYLLIFKRQYCKIDF